MKYTIIHPILSLLIMAGIVGIAVYNLEVKPAEVIVSTMTSRSNDDDVMGTSGSEAGVKAPK